MTYEHKPLSPEHSSLSLAEQKLAKEQLLVRSIKGLKVPCWFERSCKISEKKLHINRFIYIVKTTNLGREAAEKILDICFRLNMPTAFMENFRCVMPNLSHVLFGYEEGESSCGYKIYGEFNIDRKYIPKLRDPFLAALGFKWDAFDNTKQMITNYTCIPSLTIEKIHERMESIFNPQRHRNSLEISKYILALVLKIIRLDNMFYLDVADGNNPRRSFDLNVYDARLQMKDLENSLQSTPRLAAGSFTPIESYNRLYNQRSAVTFGHLSAGIDREGKEFMTIYGGMVKQTKV